MKEASYTKKIKELKTVVTQLKLETEKLSAKDIGAWRQAHQRALDIENPKRTELYNIYDYTVNIDNAVAGIVLQTKLSIVGRCFKLVDAAKKEDEKTTELFRSEWFKSYMSHALDAHYYGHSLVQLGDIITRGDKMEFSGARLVPRRHVCPEYGVLLKESGDEPVKGIPYRDGAFTNSVVECGDIYSMGAYLKVCPNAISKKYAEIFWNNFAEKFGIPIIYASIDARDKEERTKTANMLKNLGSNAWAMFNSDVKLNVIETSTGDAFEVFDRRISRADEQMSIALAGQTMAFTDGSSLSQAEVHERGFNSIKKALAENLKDNINNKLLPVMVANGFPVQGRSFEWNDVKQYTAQEMLGVETLLLQYYDIKKDYFVNKYGVDIIGEKETPAAKPERKRKDLGSLDFFA